VVNTRVLIETGRWVFHTHDVLRQIDAIQSTLVDADAGERGYLLTGDDAYLVPYRTARARTADDLTRLRDLTRDDPDQQARVSVLEPKARQALDDLGRVAELYRTRGAEAARAAFGGGAGQAAATEARRLLADLEDGEQQLLAVRAED